MTIDSSTRDKVILLRKQGKTRDDIVYTLGQSGIKISTGSCSNIIKKHEQSLQSHAGLNDTDSHPSDPQPEADAIISTGIDMSNIGSLVSASGGGVGNEPTSSSTNSNVIGLLKEDPPKPELGFVDFDNKPYPEFYPVESDVNVVNQDATTEEEESESTSPNPQDNESIIDLDLDSRAMWERKLIRAWGERSEQIRLIENGKRELEEELQQIEQMKQSIEQRENNLKVREARVAELEFLAPSVRQLQQMNVTFNMMQSYILLVNERSVLGNIDTRKVALSLSHELRELRGLGNILKTKQKAEERLKELDTLMAQKQTALNDIAERLTQLTGPRYNGNNGHDLSMNDYIRLNFKSGNRNMLNTM